MLTLLRRRYHGHAASASAVGYAPRSHGRVAYRAGPRIVFLGARGDSGSSKARIVRASYRVRAVTGASGARSSEEPPRNPPTSSRPPWERYISPQTARDPSATDTRETSAAFTTPPDELTGRCLQDPSLPSDVASAWQTYARRWRATHQRAGSVLARATRRHRAPPMVPATGLPFETALYVELCSWAFRAIDPPREPRRRACCCRDDLPLCGLDSAVWLKPSPRHRGHSSEVGSAKAGAVPTVASVRSMNPSFTGSSGDAWPHRSVRIVATRSGC